MRRKVHSQPQLCLSLRADKGGGEVRITGGVETSEIQFFDAVRKEGTIRSRSFEQMGTERGEEGSDSRTGTLWIKGEAEELVTHPTLSRV